MLDFNKMIIASDLIKFNKDDLNEIATEMDIITKQKDKSTLAIQVIDKLKGELNKTDNSKIKKIIGENLLAGKTSIKWYDFNLNIDYNTIKENIIDNSDFQILNEINIPEPSKLSTDPRIFGGYFDDENEEIYLRFIYKSSVKSEFYGLEFDTRPVPGYCTLYINHKKGLVEYRGENRKADVSIEQFLNNFTMFSDKNTVREKFDFDIDDIAEKLNGEQFDSLSRTEIETVLDSEELEAITKVLKGLDSYFKDNSIDELENSLISVNETLNGTIDDLIMPFSSLLLSGLNTVGLSGDSEIRNSPLFSYLKPNLIQTSGFIKFNIIENGIEKSYTLRVGLQTRSIYFNTPVSESVLKEVREKLLFSE